MPVTSEETSLSLGWFENFGSGTLTEMTAHRPSRRSSPESPALRSLRSFDSVPYALTVRVRAWRKPVRWAPPSLFLIVFVKQVICSL